MKRRAGTKTAPPASGREARRAPGPAAVQASPTDAGIATRSAWYPPALVFAVAIAVYASTLGHGFVWDDSIWLEQRLRFYRSIVDVFLEPADVPGFPDGYRPLTNASFWLDQWLGWRNPAGFPLDQYREVVALAGDTPTGRQASEAVAQLTAWLADPAHQAQQAGSSNPAAER